MGQIQGIKRTKEDGHDGQYDLKMFSFLHHNYQLTGTCGTCGAEGDILHFGWQKNYLKMKYLRVTGITHSQKQSAHWAGVVTAQVVPC